ncbi:MAG TPA: DUF5700 domain-containing putative Zn-dependent protease [Candidatus Limnocylindrales bacterium]|jgi:hypothetical protein|nr:DUF5700 domain-containing putative Zn-dependent protease [Candidatus Limnocylindrales bacterium]
MFLTAFLGLILFGSPAQDGGRVQVRIDTQEPEAVLSIVGKQEAGGTPNDEDWQRLFTSEGYRRLQKREAAIKHPFTDDDFRKFVLSGDLQARADKLRETVDSWKDLDVSHAAALALAYLPENASIHAAIYPSIKPNDNSFVFEIGSDPAIFIYLNPEMSREELENTLAQELHHIGFGTTCPPAEVKADSAKQSAPVQIVRKWAGAFGEGFAVLAAAGGPDNHPMEAYPQEKHEKWDLDMGRFYQNRIELDDFFMKILKGELSGDKADAQAMNYFGERGPWYTVGYRMGTVIESAFGRQRLINSACDGSFLAAFNEATASQTRGAPHPAGKSMWSPEIIKAMSLKQPENPQ